MLPDRWFASLLVMALYIRFSMAKGLGFGSIFQRKKLPDGTVLTLGVWWIKYRNGVQIIRESSGSRKQEDAERLLKRRLGEVVTGKFAGLRPERITFAQLAQEVIDDYRANEKRSIGHVKRRLKLHLLPALGNIRAAEFGTSHVKRYIASRQHAGAANATINRELAIVKRAFSLAYRNDPPKVSRIPYIPMLQENNVRKGFLEHEIYQSVLKELPEEIKPLLVAGYYLGTRVGELVELKWSQVDVSAGRITLAPGTTKNKQARTLPIYGELKQWVNKLKKERDTNWPKSQFVFSRQGEPIRNFRKSWAAACQRAGVSGQLFHDLRRTAVRNMVRAGVPEKVAMQISGQKTR